MKKILISALLIFMLSVSFTSVTAATTYDNKDLGDKTITIDGSSDDWEDVESVDVTLKAARSGASGSYSATFASAHDAERIYFLVTVEDVFYTAFGSHHDIPALGLAFNIDDDALPQYMGLTGRSDEDIETNSSSGLIDILHWEIETGPGVKNENKVTNSGNSDTNLDDEYAKHPELREDDDSSTAENSWIGAFDHSSDKKDNGTAGTWTFELSRKLDTGDEHDAQFALDVMKRVAIAYWTPSENSEKSWTDDGHFVNYDNVIEMTLKDSKVGSGGFLPLPLLPVISALAAISAIVVIQRRK